MSRRWKQNISFMVGLGYGWIGVGWVVLVCVGWMKLTNYCLELVSTNLLVFLGNKIIEYNVLRKNVGSKPWYRCWCTDDTPCHLGDAGRMTLLPWFVPRTKTPVQLHEAGPDRGYLLTESCSDVHLHVCRCRTGDGDCCCCNVGNRRQNISACTGVIVVR